MDKNKNIKLKQQAKSGDIYFSNDTSLVEEQQIYLNRVKKFNRTPSTKLGLKYREYLMHKMFAEIGEGCYIEPPIFSNFGCTNVHFGKGIYCNFNLTLVDDNDIYVGDYTMFAPNVTLATAGHPILPSLRGEYGLQYNLPIRIGKNCWLGAGTIVLPGITIGENTVIGAGSVVTKDIPSNVVAVGNPCRVLRKISEHDREYYYRDKKIPKELLEIYDK